jgi:aldose 1-epimerase
MALSSSFGVVSEWFGRMPDGTAVDSFTLGVESGIKCKVISYGATITEVHAPDCDGKMGDIVLGFDSLQPYLDHTAYFGAAIGRCANRIAAGKFSLDGKAYSLAVNNPPNHLHGGNQGFDKRVWRAEVLTRTEGPSVAFHLSSPDGDQGYPGAMEVTVTYLLTAAGELRIDYRANTTKPTPVNLTNHSYWNLAGTGTILGHQLMLNADTYTPVDADSIPTGVLAPVAGSPMDFTAPLAMGHNLGRLTNIPQGYDHNWVINGGGAALARVAVVTDPKSGRTLEVLSDQPGVQFYTGNFLDGTVTGKGGTVYARHAGFCLETQHFPDSVNHPNFPTTILRPGEVYRSTTIYRLPLG